MRASALILLALLFIGADCRRSSFGTGPARPNSSGSAPARRPEKDLGNKHTNGEQRMKRSRRDHFAGGARGYLLPGSRGIQWPGGPCMRANAKRLPYPRATNGSTTPLFCELCISNDFSRLAEFYDPMFGWGLQPVRKAGEEQRNGIDKTAFVKETRAKKQHNTQQQRAQEDQHRKKK